MAAVTVGDISQEAIDDFWRQKDYISSRSHQKGLNCALEGYINNFIVEKVDEKLQLQTKIYRSQCKRYSLVLFRFKRSLYTRVLFALDARMDSKCSGVEFDALFAFGVNAA